MKIVINAQTWPGLAFNPIALEPSDARDMPSAEDPRPVRVGFHQRCSDLQDYSIEDIVAQGCAHVACKR